MTADFHRLNILLMRASDEGGVLVGKKVATATLTGARIQASLGKTSPSLYEKSIEKNSGKVG